MFSWVWRQRPLILALRKQREAELSEFKVSLVYKSRVEAGLHNESLTTQWWSVTEEDILCQPPASTPLCANVYLHLLRHTNTPTQIDFTRSIAVEVLRIQI